MPFAPAVAGFKLLLLLLLLLHNVVWCLVVWQMILCKLQLFLFGACACVVLWLCVLARCCTPAVPSMHRTAAPYCRTVLPHRTAAPYCRTVLPLAKFACRATMSHP
jgi:hypothetical protein